MNQTPFIVFEIEIVENHSSVDDLIIIHSLFGLIFVAKETFSEILKISFNRAVKPSLDL